MSRAATQMGTVMAGFIPAIHVLLSSRKEAVDARAPAIHVLLATSL